MSHPICPYCERAITGLCREVEGVAYHLSCAENPLAFAGGLLAWSLDLRINDRLDETVRVIAPDEAAACAAVRRDNASCIRAGLLAREAA